MSCEFSPNAKEERDPRAGNPWLSHVGMLRNFTIRVPSTVAPGVYELRVTATDGNGRVRTDPFPEKFTVEAP